jgi:hypothetical protein
VLAGEVLDSTTKPPTKEGLRRREQTVTKALDLIEAGEVDAAGDFWREEMIKVSERVIRRHGRKTVVDVLG